jgi:hypothetical protein
VLRWCSERGLGLSESVVAELLGPGEVEERRLARRAKLRADALRLAAALVVAALVVVGLLAATDPPGDRTLYGRTGEVHPR